MYAVAIGTIPPNILVWWVHAYHMYTVAIGTAEYVEGDITAQTGDGDLHSTGEWSEHDASVQWKKIL